jgi:predicted ferric reductase
MSLGKRYNADWAAIVLGVGVGLTAALYIETTRLSDWSTVYSIVTSVSRIGALLGSFFAIVGLVLVSRISWVERSVGHDRLVIWHRKLGPWSLYLITIHVLLVLVGYAGHDRIKIGVELWRMIQRYPWMLPGFVAFIFFAMAGVTSYKKARAKMSYEAWWTIHLYTYLAIALSFMHQVLTGPMFIGHPLNKLYWEFLYIGAGAAIVFWRIAIPTFRSLIHNLRIEQVVDEGPGVVSVIMHGRGLDKLGAQGGQFFSWRFMTKGHWWMSHPYSLSAAPTANYMRVTIKDLGDHSKDVRNLKAGTRVFFEGPYGTFVAKASTRGHVVLIGGGVGITPLRALMEELDPTKAVDVIFRASRDEDLVLRKELDALADARGARVHYLVGSRKIHPMTAKYIMKFVPAFRDSDVYVCGPKPLVDAVHEAAVSCGIPKDRIHDEAFEFHNV